MKSILKGTIEKFNFPVILRSDELYYKKITILAITEKEAVVLHPGGTGRAIGEKWVENYANFGDTDVWTPLPKDEKVILEN